MSVRIPRATVCALLLVAAVGLVASRIPHGARGDGAQDAAQRMPVPIPETACATLAALIFARMTWARGARV